MSNTGGFGQNLSSYNLPAKLTGCEYLGITPAEFFETDSVNPSKETELAQAVRGLSNQQLDTLITLAKGLKK